MPELIKMIIEAILKRYNITEEKIKNLTPTGQARVVAYILVPSLVLSLTIWAVSKGWLGIDLERAFAISELKTVVTAGGVASAKRGVVIIAEPVQSDYQISIARNNSEIWSPLTEEDAHSNRNNLKLDGDNLNIITSLYGVSEPVAIVVEGELGEKIKFRGRKESVDDWRLSPQRNVSLVFWTLAICFIAYGIAVVRGAPVVEPDQHDASQVGAEPDKE